MVWAILPTTSTSPALQRAFFCKCIFHGENSETKSPVLTFLKKSQKRQFCFVIFSMKNASTEKKVHHDKEHGKTKKMAVSIFSVDPQKVV